jgi:hypothetical protein
LAASHAIDVVVHDDGGEVDISTGSVDKVVATDGQGVAIAHDDQGHWIEGTLLDWDDLPDRVEGAIEERIGRLKEEQRNILSVASVEGRAFTAQVIARADRNPGA